MISWYAQDILTDGNIIHYGYDDENPSTGNVIVSIEKPLFYKSIE